MVYPQELKVKKRKEPEKEQEREIECESVGKGTLSAFGSASQERTHR